MLGWPGDNVQYVYMTGWVGQSLLQGQSPFIDPHLNYPDTLFLPATDAPFLYMLAATPLTLLLGPTFAYNSLIFLSHFLSGYLVYLWIARLTGSRLGGVVAGLGFLLAPYRVVHSYGHLQLVLTPALPLFFWALDRALQPPRPAWRPLLLLGGATFLLGSASQYYLLMGLLAGAVYALLLLLPRFRAILAYSWRALPVIGLGAVASAVPYLGGAGTQVFTPYAIAETRIWSASVLDFLVPSRLHPLWGGLIEQVGRRTLWVEHTLYIGVVVGGLALVALLARPSPYRPRVLVWLGVALAAFACALGTDLHLVAWPIDQENPVWLPMYYLGQLPYLQLMRVWARFGVIVILFSCLLAGIGVVVLQERLRRWRRPALALCLALLVLDLLPGRLQATTLHPRPVDRWLAAQPGDFAAAFLPAGHDNYYAQYGSLFHEKWLPAYNHPVHLPGAFRRFNAQAAAFPAPSAVAALRALGLRYLLLSRPAFDGTTAPAWSRVESALRNDPQLRIITEQGEYVVVSLEEDDP